MRKVKKKKKYINLMKKTEYVAQIGKNIEMLW